MKPLGTRLPKTICCPTHATICEMFSVDPLDPHRAMMSGLKVLVNPEADVTLRNARVSGWELLHALLAGFSANIGKDGRDFLL